MIQTQEIFARQVKVLSLYAEAPYEAIRHACLMVGLPFGFMGAGAACGHAIGALRDQVGGLMWCLGYPTGLICELMGCYEETVYEYVKRARRSGFCVERPGTVYSMPDLRGGVEGATLH